MGKLDPHRMNLWSGGSGELQKDDVEFAQLKLQRKENTGPAAVSATDGGAQSQGTPPRRPMRSFPNSAPNVDEPEPEPASPSASPSASSSSSAAATSSSSTAEAAAATGGSTAEAGAMAVPSVMRSDVPSLPAVESTESLLGVPGGALSPSSESPLRTSARARYKSAKSTPRNSPAPTRSPRDGDGDGDGDCVVDYGSSSDDAKELDVVEREDSLAELTTSSSSSSSSTATTTTTTATATTTPPTTSSTTPSTTVTNRTTTITRTTANHPLTPKEDMAGQRIARKWRVHRAKQLLAQRRKQNVHRTKAVQELLDTERNYVADLRAVVDMFVTPLRENKLIDREELGAVFANIDIILNYNAMLLSDLEARVSKWSPSQVIGDCIRQMCEFLKVYTEYVSNFNAAVIKLHALQESNSKFAKFVQANIKSARHRHHYDLGSYLITPVQRIPRYSMLLKDIVKHTWPEHQDYEDLTVAYEKMKATASYVNQRVKEGEAIAEVSRIQERLLYRPTGVNIVAPNRSFVRQGGVLQVSVSDVQQGSKMVEPRILFLFNDILIIGAEESAHQRKLRLRSRSGSLRGSLRSKSPRGMFNSLKKHKEKEDPLSPRNDDGDSDGGRPSEVMYVYLETLELAKCAIVNLQDDGDFMNMFEILNEDAQVWISTQTYTDKAEWMAALKVVVSEQAKKAHFYAEQRRKAALQKANQMKAVFEQKYTSLRMQGYRKSANERSWRGRQDGSESESEGADDEGGSGNSSATESDPEPTLSTAEATTPAHSPAPGSPTPSHKTFQNMTAAERLEMSVTAQDRLEMLKDEQAAMLVEAGKSEEAARQKAKIELSKKYSSLRTGRRPTYEELKQKGGERKEKRKIRRKGSSLLEGDFADAENSSGSESEVVRKQQKKKGSGRKSKGGVDGASPRRRTSTLGSKKKKKNRESETKPRSSTTLDVGSAGSGQKGAGSGFFSGTLNGPLTEEQKELAKEFGMGSDDEDTDGGGGSGGGGDEGGVEREQSVTECV